MERVSNLSKINLIILLFVITLNMFTFVNSSHDIIYLLIYVLPYVVCSGLILLLRKKSFNSILLLCLSLYIAFTGDIGNFAGAVFLIFSIETDKGINKSIIKCVLLIIAITLKSLFQEITPIQIINLLIMHAVVYIYYRVVFDKKKESPIMLEDQTKQIVDYILKGLSVKEISALIYVKPEAINKRISRLVEKESCKSKHDLFFKLGQRGYKIDK